MPGEPQFLEIKDWQKYQTKLNSGKPRKDLIVVPANLEDDPGWLGCLGLRAAQGARKVNMKVSREQYRGEEE